jgi:hypothetical protein
MAIDTPFPQPGSRRAAMLDYLVEQLQKNDGRPPTIREIIDAGVGQGTTAGPITSTSVVKANLAAMTEAGWLKYEEGASRRAQLVGGYYVVASNVIHHLSLQEFYTAFIIDESAGIHDPVNPEVRAFIEQVVEQEGKTCYTFSTDMDTHGHPAVWEGLHDHACHISAPTFLQALTTPEESWEEDMPIAVITNNEAQAALAAAAGMGVFHPGNEWEQMNNQKPST